MYEYSQSLTWASSYSIVTPFVVNERVFKSTNWTTNEFWPGTGSKLAFYAYAPYNAPGITSLPIASTAGKPKFHYVTPTQAINQNDILVNEDDAFVATTNEDGGVDVPGNYNAIKYLKFKHICTAVRIAVGDQMAPCTITNIAIKGVYGEADYNYGAGTYLNMGAWENYSTDTSDFELDADFDVSATDCNKIINDGKYAFMLLPQIVPVGATLEVTINDGEEHILKANIEGDQWDMGYSVTYYLSTSYTNSNYILSVSSSETDIDGDGGNSDYSVQSYKQTFYGSQVEVPWVASYTIDDDPTVFTNEGNTVTDFTKSSDGSLIATYYDISFGGAIPLSDPTINNHTANLRLRPVVSNVNLAAGGETANCYVVSQPGTLFSSCMGKCNKKWSCQCFCI